MFNSNNSPPDMDGIDLNSEDDIIASEINNKLDFERVAPPKPYRTASTAAGNSAMIEAGANASFGHCAKLRHGSILVSPSGQRGEFLVDRRQKILAWRDFRTEIRGRLDTEHLLADSVVLLDVQQSDLSAILRKMIEALPENTRKADESQNLSSSNLRRLEERRIPYEKIHQELFTLENSKHFHVTNIEQRVQNVIVDEDGVQEDQSWFILYCSSETVVEASRVAFARLHAPTNFGEGLGDVQFIVLVISPMQQKNTKSALETARTFATLMANARLRNRLTSAASADEFRGAIQRCAEKMRRGETDGDTVIPIEVLGHTKLAEKDGESLLLFLTNSNCWFPARGIVEDFRRRIRHYKSDYTDGFSDVRSLQKTISSAVFLYFAILPTAIALGMLNESNTNGKINVNKEILSQWIGGLFFGVFGGQLFLIMLSTAPISIYIQVIHEMALQTGEDFFQLYTAIGLWCAFYLVVVAILQASTVMKFAKRSLEELFGLFISLALVFEAGKAAVEAFHMYNPTTECFNIDISDFLDSVKLHCEHAVGPVFLILLLGTVWLSVSLYEFRKTPYLTKAKREILSDYALPIGVILMAIVANLVFGDIPKATFTYNSNANVIELAPFWALSMRSHLICMGLGFPLAVLFFMDQMIVTNTVNNTQNNLKKGAAANWDLLLVGVMNAGLSVMGLPWMHGALPQAFLHLKSQADVEDRLVDGTIQQKIVKNRESRLATLLAHAAMIPTYFFLLPYLRLIPTCIFHGLFVYLAFTSTIGNEFCQRMALLFTEQRSYPPCHYNRRVPQRTIHIFTLIEFIQLAVLFFIGFAPSPIVQLTFPIITFLFIPLRSLVLPCFFSRKHLEVLDGVH